MSVPPGQPPPVDSPPPPDIPPPSDPPPVDSPPPPDIPPPSDPPPVDSPPPPDIPPPSDPPPVDSPPPPDIPPPSDPPPPDVVPPPPDVVPPTPSDPPPPPPPDVVPPTPSDPPPPPDVVPPTPSDPPPPPDVVPPTPSDPPPPDVVPPTPSDPPPPPDVVPPTPSDPPPPPDVVPPTPSDPPPSPDVVPPTDPPPPPDVPSPPPPTDPPPSTDSPPPEPSISPPPPLIPSPPSDFPPPPSPPFLPPDLTPHSSPSRPSLSPPTPSTQKPSVATPVVVVAVLGSVALLLAVLGLLWFICFRKKRKQNLQGTESYYKPGDGNYGASAQSGENNFPPGGQFSGSNASLAATHSLSNSAGFSSSQPQPLSTNGSGGLWSNTTGTDNSFLSSMQGAVLGSGTIAFTYDELKVATNGFSGANLLGQGGFGYVHKGMLQNGKIVAVKSLKADSGQGEREFQAEVETISRVHHKHLVTLVGYCITDSQKLLVYEFVQNKTMEFHLHGKGQPVMDWPTRLKIAVGAAKGLAYLHEDCHPKIIHRDIKAANILLDHAFEAQVADFGLAKFSSDANTHISTRVMGTFGYLAPEYASSGQLSDKSDVFSFGVLLLELITGRRPVDFTSHAQMEDSLVDWARPLLSKALQDGNFDPLVDPRLENNYNSEEVGAMITCAASCVRHSAKRRPRMSQVFRALEGSLSLSDLNDGVKPGFSTLYSSTDLYGNPNKEDMLRFRKMAYGSEDGASSDFSATRSEYIGGR